MDSLLRVLETPDPFMADYSLRAMFATLLMAFVLGQAISWVYAWTHRGPSYSLSFTQSLMLMTIIVSLVMRIIGTSIITAFGLLGALALIRFRNVLKDTRDTVFVFVALVIGMSVGSQRHLTAIVGTLTMMLVILYHRWTAFGSAGNCDGYLTWNRSGSSSPDEAPARDPIDASLARLMDRFCSAADLVSTRQAADARGSEYVYEVHLRDRNRSSELVEELRKIAGLSQVSFVMRNELSEV